MPAPQHSAESLSQESWGPMMAVPQPVGDVPTRGMRAAPTPGRLRAVLIQGALVLFGIVVGSTLQPLRQVLESSGQASTVAIPPPPAAGAPAPAGPAPVQEAAPAPAGAPLPGAAPAPGAVPLPAAAPPPPPSVARAPAARPASRGGALVVECDLPSASVRVDGRRRGVG